MKKLLSLILTISLMLSLTSCNMLGEVEQINDSLTIYVDKNQQRELSEAIKLYKYEIYSTKVHTFFVPADWTLYTNVSGLKSSDEIHLEFHAPCRFTGTIG